jgi:signal transduction histidine kinase
MNPPATFVSDIIHELRTPLVPIVGYAEMLLHERLGGLSPKQKDSVSVILRNCHRMQDLVDELLDWIRFQEGRLVVDKTTIEPAPFFDEILLEHRSQIQERSIVTEVSIEENAPVLADRAGIRRIVSGIIEQAVKLTRRGGTIAIRATPAPSRLRIAIRYDGPLPADDVRWAIYQPMLAAHGSSLQLQEIRPGETEIVFDLERK